jgi:HlyD family secretion protein
MRRSQLLALGVTLAALAGCDRPAATPAPAPAAAAAVTVVRPEMRPVNRVVEQPGAVEAFEETALVPKFPGYVRALGIDPAKADRPVYDRHIDIGSRVTAGQLLAELAVPELDEDLKQKEALVRQAEAEVEQSKKALVAAGAGVTAAQAQVAEAKAGTARAEALYDRWKSEAARVGRLVTGGVIDSQSRDETDNQLKAAAAGKAEVTAKVASADADVTKAEADRDKAAADVIAAGARLDVAKAGVGRVAAMREYTRIKAPYAGVITRRAANTGDFVTADAKTGLFAVARVDPVRVVVNVPEADAGLVSPGQQVRVAFQATNGPALTGKVARTSWALAPGSRTLRTEVDLPNLDGTLRPGMYVSTLLTAELPPQWAVPVAAVGKVNDEPIVYLVENGKAVRVAVQLLQGDARFTQIRQYKRPGAADWSPFTGEERLATPAAAVTDGQTLPAEGSPG